MPMRMPSVHVIQEPARKFYVPLVTYPNPSLYANDVQCIGEPWQQVPRRREPPVSPLSTQQLTERAQGAASVMWHPLGPIDFLNDPFERLHIKSIAKSESRMGQVTVVVCGVDSRQDITRSIAPRTGSHSDRNTPVFCDCKEVSAEVFIKYKMQLYDQLEQLLLSQQMKTETRVDKLNDIIARWSDAPTVWHAHNIDNQHNKQSTPDCEEKTMSSKSDSPMSGVFNKFKTSICNAATRGGKVAMSVTATDEILSRTIRRAVGQYYPEFFIKNPIGRAIEPIALASVVLLGSYLMKAYTTARVPFQDEVEAAAKYSMEGKFRDLVELAKGPVLMVFNQIGTELGGNSATSA